MRGLVGGAVAALILALAAPVAGAATTPKTETATEGAVTATLTYTVGKYDQATDVKLAITRDGAPAAVARNGDVEGGCDECTGAMPIGGMDGSEANSLTVTDLQGNGEPEVIVDLFTGGAHCCSISAIYGWDAATSSYQRLVWLWGDPGYSLKKLRPGAATQLVSADDRFAYTFCAYACSAMPPVVYEYNGTTLVDVTRQFPDLVREDAKGLRSSIARFAKSKHPDERFVLKGLVAPLCADYYLLDEGAKCKPLLSKAKRRGWLANDGIWKGGQAYVNQTLRLLKKWGYR